MSTCLNTEKFSFSSGLNRARYEGVPSDVVMVLERRYGTYGPRRLYTRWWWWWWWYGLRWLTVSFERTHLHHPGAMLWLTTTMKSDRLNDADWVTAAQCWHVFVCRYCPDHSCCSARLWQKLSALKCAHFSPKNKVRFVARAEQLWSRHFSHGPRVLAPPIQN